MGKEVQNDAFQNAKLAKTKARRKKLARQREVVEGHSRPGRNDLLPALELRHYRLAELKPPKHRTRKDDLGHVARLVRAIADFGFSQPILVHEGQVHDGWSRVLAARELGLEEVPAIECGHLSNAVLMVQYR